MSLGRKLAAARKQRGLSQSVLAERLEVSPEAVSKWEQDVYKPSDDKLAQLEKLLNLSAYDEDGNLRGRRFFDEEHMSAFLKGKLAALGLNEAIRALSYAKSRHAGMFRKPVEAGIPYINHPLTMACHAMAMGLAEDELISSLLLHDVSEDCGVAPEELPFSPGVREIVALVTKPEKPFREQDYYGAIRGNPRACLVKCIDRCSNLSSMAMGFSTEKIAEYVEETEAFYPGLLRIVKECPEYNNAAWLLEYQIRSLLETAKRIR